MPQFNLTDQELDDLAAFLEWVSKIDTQGWPPNEAARAPEGTAQMAYASQRVAYWYFVCALGLFLAQVLFGVLAGRYVFPNFLSELLPFHILRMIHTNALIVWLPGFFGATYYLLPRNGARDPQHHFGLRAACDPSPGCCTRGRGLPVPHPPGPRVPGAAHAHQARDHGRRADLPLQCQHDCAQRSQDGRIERALLAGGRRLFLFAFYNLSNLVVDKIYWWWVVHIWVEGVWELIMAAILAFLLIRSPASIAR